MPSELKITGLDKVMKTLDGLPKKVRNKVLRQALRAGAKIVQAQAKENAPVDTGELKANIKVRAAAKRKRGEVAIEVRVGEGDFKGDQFYAAFQEFGTVKMPAHPFMTPAYETEKDKAKAIIEAKIIEGLDQIVKGG